MNGQGITGEREREGIYRDIWDRYARRISCFISAMLPGESAFYEDLHQEVMMKILEGLSSFDRNGSFQVWAYRIARNHCIDHLRTRRVHEEAGDSIPGREGDPVDEMERSDLDRAIRKVLDGLGSDDRQIAYLRFYEGMRIGDISASLEMNGNTVKTRIRAIKRILRHELEEWR